MHGRLRDAALRRVDRAGQRLDQAAAHLGRPSARTAQQHLRIERQAQRLRFSLVSRVQRAQERLAVDRDALRASIARRIETAARGCERLQLRLQLLDPRLVLQRGYALLMDAESGHAITSAAQVHAGQAVRASLADGEVDLRVLPGPGARA